MAVNTRSKPWSEAEGELAVRRFREGASFSQVVRVLVAAGFAPRTRSAVAGWLSRRGVERSGAAVPKVVAKPQCPKLPAKATAPVKPAAALPPPPPPARPAAPPAAVTKVVRLSVPTAPKPVPKLPAAPPPSGAVRLADAGERVCRTPVSGEGADLFVCGAPTAPRVSACAACHARLRVPTARVRAASVVWLADRAGRVQRPDPLSAARNRARVHHEPAPPEPAPDDHAPAAARAELRW